MTRFFVKHPVTTWMLFTAFVVGGRGARRRGSGAAGDGAALVRRGLPLRWRMAVFTALATLLIGVAATAAAYVVTRGALVGDLRAALVRDVERVVENYRGSDGARPELVAGPTGRVGIHLYAPSGERLAASGAFDGPDGEALSLPPDSVANVWNGADEAPVTVRARLGERDVLASLAPFEFGVVAVLADTAYIGRTLTRLARSLAAVAVVVALGAAALGYLAAAASIRPIAWLARTASTRGPDRLEPIPVSGPRDEVDQLARVLNDLIERLKGALDAQRSFLAETSHELRTPLTSLRGFVDRAHRRATPEVRRDLDDARRVADTMARLVEDLLQLSRGQLVRDVEPHLVEPVADVMRPVAEEFPGVRIAETESEDRVLVGDPERLRQLVRNLTANAVRAAGADGVEVACRSHGSWVVLEVRDDGPGIPPEEQEGVFDKFRKGVGGGAGLGLAIARQVAEHHGGTLDVESRPGRTVFRVRLPAAVQDEG